MSYYITLYYIRRRAGLVGRAALTRVQHAQDAPLMFIVSMFMVIFSGMFISSSSSSSSTSSIYEH